MGKSSPSPPPAPDPMATAQAQSQFNIDAARAQQQMNMVNQVTPWGSLTYQPVGGQPQFNQQAYDAALQQWQQQQQARQQAQQQPSFGGMDVSDQYRPSQQQGGAMQGGAGGMPMPNPADFYTTPSDRWEAVTQLSPEQQRLLETGQTGAQMMGDLGVQQLGQLQDTLGQPINLTNEETERRLMELGTSRLAPMLQQRRQQMESSLVSRGVVPGSQAWNREMEQLRQYENDLYNQLMLSGRQQSVQEQLLGRTQPLNELAALMSGTQVGMPQFAPVPQAGVVPPDFQGQANMAHQNQLAAWQQQQQGRQSALGGLFGLGGSALGGWAMGGFNPLGAAAGAASGYTGRGNFSFLG